MTEAGPRRARGGVLIVGGGFAGASVASRLGHAGATIVSPQNYMLYTPLLPEAASGGIEPRHATVPLRLMCPHAEVVLGRAVGHEPGVKALRVATETGEVTIAYDHLVLAAGAVTRTLPIPGLAEHGVGFKSFAEAVHLRNRLLRALEVADTLDDPGAIRRRLGVVVVGAGYAGVEALAEMRALVSDALGFYPRLAGAAPRWVLVDLADRILPEVPRRLADYARQELEREGIEVRTGTTLDRVEPGLVHLSDGEVVEADTVVWTAGVRANPLARELGLPTDDHGRVLVDPCLRVEGADGVWALGDNARVPNQSSGRPDPPSAQHALQQARLLAVNIRRTRRGRAPIDHRYTALGQVATVGRYRGVAEIGPLHLRGLAGWGMARAVHLAHIPLRRRQVRVALDWSLSLVFRRDIAQVTLVPERPDPPPPG